LSNLLFRACQALLYDWEEIINKKISTVGKLNASVSTHPLPVNSTALTFQRCPPVLPLSALDTSETGRCRFLPRTRVACVLLPCWTLGSRTVSAALRESGNQAAVHQHNNLLAGSGWRGLAAGRCT
jgi:hypothetical protein